MSPPTFAEVALPLPLRQAFTYEVPPTLREAAQVGARVLAPFGPRRLQGWLVALDVPRPAGIEPRPLADVLDEPQFDEPMLRFFRWIAGYYHESLGEVIRAALPAGQRAEDVRTATLTDVGRERLGAVLDQLDGRDRRLLASLEGGPLPLPALLARADAPAARALDLHHRGLLTLTWELAEPAVKPRLERVARPLGEPAGRLTPKDLEILAAIRAAPPDEPVPVRELNRRFKAARPNLERLEAAGAVHVEEVRVFRAPAEDDAGGEAAATPPPLTPDQAPVVARVTEALDTGYRGFLLHGVTGSGKTEVYLRLIAAALDRGRGAIVLVPEIALTPQLVARFRARFGGRIAVLHSALSDGERLDQWVRIARGDLDVVVGARSAIFAPVRSLGVVVVDEEHETSFKQEERPRYHARDLALVRGTLSGCPVVLGSATPSLESHHNALTGRLERLVMRNRANASPLPAVQLVDLRKARRCGPHGLLAAPLAAALAETAARGEQAILFLNRRGFSSFVVCGECGFIPECPSCSISLSFSQRLRTLRCHYCGHAIARPTHCPACATEGLEPVGFGTERVQEDVEALLPGVSVARMDRDTTRGAALNTLLAAFRRREIQVLVGTQMVAKGHDFPGVTLVGVLLADQGLKFPDFRASERTFQLLTQVAGRAGRGDLPGRVLIQTFDPAHHALVAALTHDWGAFVASELPVRRVRDYPPFCHVCMVRITDSDERRAEALGRELFSRLQSLAVEPGEVVPSVWILGPAWAPIQKIKNKVRLQILIKSRHRQRLHGLLGWLDAFIDERNLAGTVAVDVDPVNLL
ncbi:MAG: primosomal protein N' [Myxococcales bacterium]